jgi:hypothetical protein
MYWQMVVSESENKGGGTVRSPIFINHKYIFDSIKGPLKVERQSSGKHL